MDNSSHPEIIPFLLAGQVLGALFFVPYTIVFFCTLTSLVQRQGQSKTTLLPLYILLGNTFFSLLFNAITFIMSSWPLSGMACRTSVDLVPPFFTVSQMLGFFFLYLRAAVIVNTKLSASTFQLALKRFILMLTACIGPWGVFVSFFTTAYVIPEACILSAPNWASALQLFLGLIVASLYLYLFIEPVLQHAKKMASFESESAMRMRRIAIWNLKLSVIAILSGVIDFTFMTVAMFSDSRALDIMAVVLCSVDVWINNAVYICMLNTWIPHPIDKWLYKAKKKLGIFESALSMHSSKESKDSKEHPRCPSSAHQSLRDTPSTVLANHFMNGSSSMA